LRRALPYGASVVAVSIAVVSGCGASEPSNDAACVTDLPATCAPQYSPTTFPVVFDKILRPTCASGRGTCHTSDARKGGLVFDDADESYALLLGQRDGRSRVRVGDPACSLLVERLRAPTPTTRMPPGPTALTEGEICTVTQWIAAGAKR